MIEQPLLTTREAVFSTGFADVLTITMTEGNYGIREITGRLLFGVVFHSALTFLTGNGKRIHSLPVESIGRFADVWAAPVQD